MTLLVRPPGLAPRVVRISPRSALTLALASVAGLAMFLWPLFISVSPAAQGHASDAPLFFVLTMPLLIAVVVAELSEGGLDSKAQAARFFGATPSTATRAAARRADLPGAPRDAPPALLRRIAFRHTPVENCGGGRRCVPFARWEQAWDAMRSG